MLMQRPLVSLLLAAAAVGATAALAGCASARADGEPAGRPFRVGVVGRGPVRVLVEETGVVEPERQVVVKSPISGVVDELLVREGDRVAPGQPMARIVPDIAQAASFAQLRSDIARAEIDRANADDEWRRARDLAATGGITQADLQARRATLDRADNALRTARAQLATLERTGVNAGGAGDAAAEFAVIRAPSAGVVIRRGVERGETVVGGTSTFGGGTELFTVADLSLLKVKAAINEVDIGKVHVGDSVRLSVDAFPGDTVTGTVRLVPPAARLQDRVRVFDVEIRVPGSAAGERRVGEILRPGMTANVRIEGPAKADVLRLPVEAVLLDEGKPVVYVVRGPGAPAKTPVTLGLGDLSWTEVLSGVAAGDSVALEDPAAAAERAANPARRK